MTDTEILDFIEKNTDRLLYTPPEEIEDRFSERTGELIVKAHTLPGGWTLESRVGMASCGFGHTLRGTVENMAEACERT